MSENSMMGPAPGMHLSPAGQAISECVASVVKCGTASVAIFVLAIAMCWAKVGFEEEVLKGVVVVMALPWALPLLGLLDDLRPRRRAQAPVVIEQLPTSEPVVVERIRPIPVHRPNTGPMIEAAPGEDVFSNDVKEFIKGSDLRGFARRNWTNEDDPEKAPYQFKSGTICDQITWRKLMNFCHAQGWVTSAGRGKATRLNGITIEEVLSKIDAL